MIYTKEPIDIKTDVEKILDVNNLKKKSQERNLVMYRNLYFKLCRKFTTFSLSKIGNEVKRDHSTVIYGSRKYDDLLQYFPKVAKAEKMLITQYHKEAINNIEINDASIEII